ncbi:hypothetical protein HNP55_004098 [Paucibacter oligotrophus]|uniref:DUF1631 family protein n=1 Tax=Roseateles oligotrophus TaxID=1769250 RepID=A0A840LBL2_9BURK|nr:DUF1631 family protein [Roseateles oligotrophus]MBB4845546.1 hypothetical protein [Roseateles oligotrophus]
MTDTARNKALASQARRIYVEALVRGMAGVVQTLNEAAALLLQQPSEHLVMMARRDGVQAWNRLGPAWSVGVVSGLRHAAVYGILDPSRATAHAAKPGVGEATGGSAGLSLVDDDTIEREITASRLSLAMMDKATWEFTDLRTRMQVLERQDDLASNDLLRANVVAKLILDAWSGSGLGVSEWQMLRLSLHEEFSLLLGEAYHEVNRWLISQSVLPDVDLRPFIRRALNTVAAGGPGQAVAAGGLSAQIRASSGLADVQAGAAAAPAGPAAPVQSPSSSQAEEVLQLLQRIVGRQVPAFATTAPQMNVQQAGAEAELPTQFARTGSSAGQAATEQRRAEAAPRLNAAIKHAQHAMQEQVAPLDLNLSSDVAQLPPVPQLLEDLQQRNHSVKQVLKQAADTPAERATIELVAMMFQSILMEDHIPAAVRVWFARLQMPVLRVAVSEPDFFATTDHPARQLIDRMGSCVMGFSSNSGNTNAAGDPLEREIKRVVQVVEAYPDTGRRVFQTVLSEFEKFLDNYFEHENQNTRHGVSLAQQVEQRETLAIQYTIELRKMLAEVPVQDGIREFLFQVWADVLAVTAVRSGAQSEAIKQMRRAAADLIWSASAKVSREERAEVIRRLPPLLKTLREGMGLAGLPLDKQDDHVRSLNNALAAAFTAKTAVIPRERLEELMDQLETLEAMLPEPDAEGGGEVQINQSLVRDLSGHETEGLEVVSEGGSAPTPAMLAWARELQVGGWYMLDYRHRNEAVQLAWRGQRRQMALFVTTQGRGVLFPLSRMAAFLQAGLLLPAQDEALTVKATRNALAKLDVDPDRLLN